MFRVLFPSWTFFDKVGTRASLFCRWQNDTGAWSQWTPMMEKQSRKWWGLFLNSDANLHLALATLVEQLLLDVERVGKDPAFRIQESVSYLLVKSWVRREWGQKSVFQFKLSVASEDVLISSELRGRDD